MLRSQNLQFLRCSIGAGAAVAIGGGAAVGTGAGVVVVTGGGAAVGAVVITGGTATGIGAVDETKDPVAIVRPGLANFRSI